MDLSSPNGQLAEVLITLGGLYFVGIAADWLGRISPLPRVTLLLLTGFLVGPSGLDWLPVTVVNLFPILTAIALTMVGFLLGQRMTRSEFDRLGKEVLTVSITIVLLTCAAVAGGLFLLGAPLPLALILGAIATATAPAATLDVIKEIGAKGKFSRLLIGIVAIDDVWGLLLFGLMLGAAQGLGDVAPAASLLSGLGEIALAILVGIGIGLPSAYLTGRIRSGEPTQVEAIGLIFLTAGVSLSLNISYILSAMVLGATVVNIATHHKRPFRAIEGIEWPFLVLFFVLAGASLDFQSLGAVGVLGIAYIALRFAGRVIGANVGGLLAATSPNVRHWLGLTLLPQAGIPVGLALHASQVLPKHADAILAIVLGSTVVFELVGPALARAVLSKNDGATA